jgi:hypothetical protein
MQFGEKSCAIPVRARLKTRVVAMIGFLMRFGVMSLFIGVGVVLELDVGYMSSKSARQ